MLKQRILLLLALCVAAPAQAGLFSDDEARTQIQQLETLVLKLEERLLRLEGAAEQQVKSLFDLHGQIEVLNSEIRNLRGQNEELAHGLRDAEKREKDFYVDLDTRLRRFELTDNAVPDGSAASAAAEPADPDDPVAENRAFEASYGLFKGQSYASSVEAFQAFLNKYPGSVHVPNASFWLGNAQFALNDHQGALDTYRRLIKAFPGSSRVPDVLFAIAECQRALKQDAAAQKTLKQLVSKHPSSDAAVKAKELITSSR